MSSIATKETPRRHPWLAALVAAPEQELRALVGGYAEIAPFGRAEPADAAVSLLFGLAADDPASRAFDAGCHALLEELRQAMLEANESRFRRFAATLDRLLAVIRRTRPPGTVRDLHMRYAYWFGVLETSAIDHWLDPRREYWRVLALTQDMVGEDLAPRRLMALWFDICAEVGPLGRYNETYLDVGLTGLRRLSLGSEHDTNEEAVCHGIARWAARQRPDKKTFVNRWYEIESAYPRAPTYWPLLGADVIAAVEDALRLDTKSKDATFPAAAWWRAELDLPPASMGSAPPSERRRAIEPPPREARERILRDVATRPIETLEPRIERLLTSHRRYADATGDLYYLVRTACNVGMRLLRQKPAERAKRGVLAARLARQALDYAPANVYAWALWRDGLAAQGAVTAVETVGWEAVRRFPEDPQWRSQLATLLTKELGRSDEAERLLRETMGLFPVNAVVRAQLATLLAEESGRYDEAERRLRETIVLLPDHPHTYTQLAILLADHFERADDAIGALEMLLKRQPDDTVARDLLTKMRAGQRLRRKQLKTKSRATVPTETVEIDIDFPAARARRALFLVETAGNTDREEALAVVKRILAEYPGLAYARYVAERLGLPSTGRPETAFAFAFEKAVGEGSADVLEALRGRTHGVDAYIVRAGLTLVSGETSFELPEAANDVDEGAASRRLGNLTGEISPALERPDIDRSPFQRLLSDFAASGLSLALAA